VFLLAFIQAAIQLFMFMHISEGEHKLWQIGKMIASGLIAIIIVVGSVWVLTSMH
jgi:cytochrome aa3-600 menaquinol oxidase subunit 4